MHNRIKLHAFFFGKNNERKGKSMIVQLIENIYQFLWGEWIHVPLPGGGSLGLSLLIILLLPAGIVFTIKTRFLPIRLFPDMVKALTANNKNGNWVINNGKVNFQCLNIEYDVKKTIEEIKRKPNLNNKLLLSQSVRERLFF